MRVYVQWAKSVAGDWEEHDSSNWSSLPSKGPPGSNPAVDNSPGWLNALNIQGAIVEGFDRVAVIHSEENWIDVWAVNDDPVDWSEATRYARKVRIYPLQPDSELDGAISTRFEQTIYTDDPIFSAAPVQNTTVEPWSNAVMPDVSEFRYGVMLKNGLFMQHQAAQSRHTWREWTDGVPAGLLSNGVVSDQRKAGRYVPAKGTRTYYANNVAEASGAHAGTYELALGTAPAGISQISGNVNTNGTSFLVGSTPANEPNSAAWPTGDYRMQIDASIAGFDLTFGLLTQGTATGHFARVDSALASDLESKAQQEAAFAFPGLKLATTGSVSWAAGVASNRFECVVACVRIAGHGNATFELEVGEFDDFADGPWTSATPSLNVIVFGTNT